MRRTFLTICLLAFLGPLAHALYIRPDLENIPVERLVKNLEERAEKEPKNAQIRLNLARVHGMAYAKKTDTVEVWVKKADQGAWFGYEPAFVPFAKLVKKAASDADRDAAKKHLDKAIATYQATIKIDPQNLAARLGLAWCLTQTDDKKAAVQALREVVEAGWAKDGTKKFAGLGGHFITMEGAGYLIPLLDADKDRDEITKLNERIAYLKKLPRPVTPIAIPLADGLSVADMVDASARVPFDADGSGFAKRWTWITPKAGWLVLDIQGKGKIASALQMFGSVSFWTFWDNGYQALSLLDDNHDGELTGKELEGLAIWRDANGDGVSDADEVRPLSAYGMVALSCRGETYSRHSDCTVYSPGGVRFAGGQVRATYDLILRPR